MEILNVKVEREMAEKLERLVRQKAFKNKSEAVRSILEEHFQEHPGLFISEDFDGLVREADKISDKEFVRLAATLFRGKKTAAQMVAEGRARESGQRGLEKHQFP
jgi:hypothetical protein